MPGSGANKTYLPQGAFTALPSLLTGFPLLSIQGSPGLRSDAYVFNKGLENPAIIISIKMYGKYFFIPVLKFYF